MASFIKDPDASLDYELDWTLWLEGDTINSSSWAVPTGITIDSDSFTNQTATVWLSGGTLHQKYEAVNRIITAGGRTDDRTITIRIKQK